MGPSSSLSSSRTKTTTTRRPSTTPTPSPSRSCPSSPASPRRADSKVTSNRAELSRPSSLPASSVSPLLVLLLTHSSVVPLFWLPSTTSPRSLPTSRSHSSSRTEPTSLSSSALTALLLTLLLPRTTLWARSSTTPSSALSSTLSQSSKWSSQGSYFSR